MNSASVLKNQRGGVLKVILIILGSLALLIVVSLIGLGWYGKKKLDEAGGMQGLASKMMAKGVEVLKPELEKSLSPEDKQRFEQALALLQQNAATLSSEQIRSVSEAVQKLGEKMQGGALSEADAKAFVDQFSAALQPPAPQ